MIFCQGFRAATKERLGFALVLSFFVFYSLFCIFLILFNNFHHFRQSKINTFKTAVLHGSVARLWRIFKDPVIIEGEALNQTKGVEYEIIKVIP